MAEPPLPDKETRPRVVIIPADQVVEPPDIVRMREALARGELGNPDAEIADRYRVLSPEEVETYRTKRKAKTTPK